MADEDVRAPARAILLLDHEGDTNFALVRDHELAATPAHRLYDDLRHAASFHAPGGGESKEDVHLGVARDALLEARLLDPNCVDIAAALVDVFWNSMAFGEAESEFRCAQSIPCRVDLAENNAAYGLYAEEKETTAAERMEEATDRARRAYARMTVEELVPLAVERVLDAARQSGAAEGRKQAKRVAEAFPNLARAQYLNAYMDLEFVRGLEASIDRRPFLRRTLTIAERAAQAFPRSAVIATFLAKLVFVLGEYYSAEKEYRLPVGMREPDDPHLDCVPPGSISAENSGARLVSLACEFHELLNKILMLAKDYWDSISSERQEGFLSVKLDLLQEYWVCPICDGKKFLESAASLLSHMCSKHPSVALPWLQSVLDPKHREKALECDDFLDGVSLGQDSNHQDVIRFDKRSDLFYAPSSGVRAKPFQEIPETKPQKGNMLLESIEEKMKTLSADKSTTEFAHALPEINDMWHSFLRTSVLDYRAMIATLARSFLWKELKKCMTEDQKAAPKFISAADIDEVFTKGDEKDVQSHESEVQAAETTGIMVNDTELSGPPINETEGERCLSRMAKETMLVTS